MKASYQILSVILVILVQSQTAKARPEVFLDSQTYQQRLERGDLGMLEELGEARDFGRLYLALSQSKRAVLGEYSEAVKAKTLEVLSGTPGHAQYLGDKIEDLGGKAGQSGRIERTFELLSLVRSAEAIQQIARFLRDPRPADPYFPEGGAPNPMSVRYNAGVYFVKALGEDSPIKPRPFYKPITLADVEVLADWWDSDASLPWRQPKVAAVIHEPEPVKAPAKEEAAKPKVEASPGPPPPQEGEWLLPVLLILAGAGLVVWIAAQSTRRRR